MTEPIQLPAGDQDHPAVPPIGMNERVYRRLSHGWYKTGKPKPIPQRFFMPRPWASDDKPGDPDGISINRACLTDVVTASTRRDNGERDDLAEFGVSNVVAIGLTVAADPLLDDISHALVPELNSLDRRDAQKESMMQVWALALRDRATLIPRDSIVA